MEHQEWQLGLFSAGTFDRNFNGLCLWFRKRKRVCIYQNLRSPGADFFPKYEVEHHREEFWIEPFWWVERWVYRIFLDHDGREVPFSVRTYDVYHGFSPWIRIIASVETAESFPVASLYQAESQRGQLAC